MLDQLKKIFPSLTHYEEMAELPEADYQWYQTQEGDVIGICREELTDKDTDLLAAFLRPFDIRFPLMTETERQWKRHIDGLSTEHTVSPYRFVYFSIQKDRVEPRLFREAIHQSLARPVPILWKNEQEGILIEEGLVPAEDSVSYEQIIDVLMSDLYVKINFFIGPYVKETKDAGAYYGFLMNHAPSVLPYSDGSVLTFTDSIPYLLIDGADREFLCKMPALMLREFADDEEMLSTVRIFIESNMNVSVAAKQLFMHRNSLQYRLDKFISRTGIDIRQFHQAVSVYLALLARN
ncbi:PucR family transcriptional regulator [Virgibacillus xinjiangensis]|uniref:PucR family transcriptional regulator n=1 Tax=Virgibacillus xinjiangensis TaxID=393090 RepID=A0ABV7CT12_9BACI